MKKNKKIPVGKVQEFPWEKKGSFKRIDPFTMIFVYPMNSEPFLLKGGCDDCEASLTRRLRGEPAAYNKVYFKGGKTRGAWYFENIKASWSCKNPITNHYDRNWQYLYLNGKAISNSLGSAVKRIPRCFPNQLQEAINEGKFVSPALIKPATPGFVSAIPGSKVTILHKGNF